MLWVCYTTILLATVVSANYYIDNANTSIQYSMAPTQSGQGWRTFSVFTQPLSLNITNSTGSHTIALNASLCYDQNYALGVCGSGDNCYVQIPFVGSGIVMYVFNAGVSGMTASFSIDGGAAVPKTIQAPPGPTFQVSKVPIYSIQGLTSGFHNMTMMVLDWEGSATSMKFDYAYVNETLVTPRVTTSSSTTFASTSSSTSFASTTSLQSQTPSQSSVPGPTSKKINLRWVVGGTVGGFVTLAALATCLYWLCKRHTPQQEEASPSLVSPFTSELGPNVSDTPRPLPVQYHHEAQRATFFARQPATNTPTNPLQFALGAGTLRPTSEARSQSIVSGMATASHPTRHLVSNGGDSSLNAAHSSALADLPFLNSQMPSPSPQYHDHSHLTASQLELVGQLRTDKVPEETIVRVVKEMNAPSSGSFGFFVSNPSSGRTSGEHESASMRPPSYQTEVGHV